MEAKQVAEVLDALALRFGATGSMLWAALIKQAYIDAIQSLIMLLVSISIMVLTYKNSERLGIWSNENDGEPVLFALAALNIICIAIAFICLTSLPNVLNPEYFALKLILDSLN